MGLSAGDRARLGRIEAELAGADPALVARFRRWRPSADDESAPPGWSAVPAWTVLVFLVAFCAWVLAPSVGWLVAIVGAVCWLRWRRAARKATPHPAAGNSGWWYRPIDRW